ncbi:MAG: two-component system response regulator [Gemmatimonadetes bacterium]|jgi:DNA-binding response OmpR family regulator|nr:two-component system response regulator [Gemmatimonadota bacterium]
MPLIGNRPSPTESAPQSHVLLVSRSPDLAARLRGVLVDTHTSLAVAGSMAELDAITQSPDLVVLDAALPDAVSPREIARLRHRWLSALVVATGVGGEAAATGLLDAGVDDAIERRSSWPYTAARIGAAARRTRMANALLRRRMGDVVYDRDNRRVWCAGEEIEFAPRELALLDALWLRAGELVRHDSLYDYVWSGTDEGERSNRLEVYISYIRRKLLRSNEVTIQTLRGAGYRLVRKSAVDTPWERDEG